MMLPPILETATELFDALQRIKPTWKVRTKYGVLREVLTVGVDQKLREVTIKMSGLYAKVDYLVKQYQLRENDRSLSFAINDARNRLRYLSVTPDAELETAWGTDLKAVARFIELIYDVPVPKELQVQFPLNTQRMVPKRLRDGADKVLDYFRCTILRWDNTYIYATREDTDQEVRINYVAHNDYVPGDWTYLRQCMVQGEALNVVRPRVKGNDILPELLIYAPDYLINVTTVSKCFTPFGCTAFAELVERIKPVAQSRHILLGNFAGQLLDEVAYGEEHSYAESIKAFFKRNALSIATCPDIDATFHADARQQRSNIEHIMHNEYTKQTAETFRSDHIILEPSFFSDMLGLQGRMDFLDLNFRTVIEQKSGKCKWQPGVRANEYTGKQEPHYVQVLLYRALLHYDYQKVDSDHMQAFLLYSRYVNGLDAAPSAPNLLFEAIKLRNQLAWCEGWYAQGGMRLLETLTPQKLHPGAFGSLWTQYTLPQLELLFRPIHQATSLERAYYFRFLQFVANEQVLSKIGNRNKENAGFAATWTSSLEDKRQAGNIYENLTLHPDEVGDRVENITFSFCNDFKGGDADLSNFRVGDIVFFYPYQPGSIPDATATMVFRCTITDIQPQSVRVRLRNAQTSRTVFEYFNKSVWAMEHDFMDSSYNAQYRGLHAFLSAPQERRDLLLGQRRPAIDTSITHLVGDYGSEEFNNLVLHARQARDLYLVIGPPGTGKTSFGMKNILMEELLQPGTNVLLLSYTNRAVDEICSKLVEVPNLDFIRLGSDFSCEARYRSHLLSERIAQMEQPNVQRVRNLIANTRVFCGTTTALNAALSLLELKQFDLAIVDEASQILEPHIISLMSALHCGESAIKRFVLIGDERQLPAVVQQGTDESSVDDPTLQAIGLTDCRLSLFERLLHLYGYNADGSCCEEVCHLLTRQGRMHREISAFPSEAFYEGKLCEVPLPHQTAPTSHPLKGQQPDWMDFVLKYRRMSFVSCVPSDNPDEPDKVNQLEANIIAQLVVKAYKSASKTFNPLLSVGVIVPYRNQISTVRTAIDRYGISCLHNITIDTVERYQGSQRDLIIYSFTAKKKYQLQFLTNNEYVDPRTGSIIDRKLNVAMTRARCHLVLIGNAPLLNAGNTFSRLIAYAKKNDSFFVVNHSI